MTGVESVVERCHWWEERREQLDYEIDGVVVKIDQRALWSSWEWSGASRAGRSPGSSRR